MIAPELSPSAQNTGTDGSPRSSADRRPTRVLLCTPYAEGVTQGPFFSFEQYLGSLAADGYLIVRSPFVPKALSGKVREKGHLFWKLITLLIGYCRRVWDLLRAPMFDGVYVSDWFVPFGPAWLNQLPSRCFKGSVLDICDRIYEPYESDRGSIVSKLRQSGHAKCLAAGVSEVVVVTRFMKEELLDVGRPITLISSSLDTTKYTPGGKSHGGRPVVGWTGSRSTSKYLRPIEPALVSARQRVDFDFVVIGDPGFRFDRFEARILPWSAEEEVASLRLLDVGLYPLDDDEWVKGKAGMKAIQYMSMGIPVIASPVGVTPDLVMEGVTGYLVDSAEAWTEAIVRLVEDSALRRTLGANGRALIESRYSTSVLAPVYSALFARVFRRE